MGISQPVHLPVDFSSTTHLSRFIRAFEWSRMKLSPFQRQTAEINRLLAGSRYGSGATPRSNPIPFLQMVHSVYVRSLVASSPRAMVSTKVRSLKPVAHAMEIAVDHQVREMQLAETLRQVASDALCAIGIIKIGVCYDPKEGTQGLLHDYGEPYCDSVPLDDFVMDMSVKRFDQCGYVGNRFRVPRQALLFDPRYDPDRINKLAVGQLLSRNEFGDDTAQAISVEGADDADFEDMIDLWEFWFPRDNTIAVMASSHGRIEEQPLYVKEYTGPELGPYQLLRFNALSSNLMPAAPLLHLADMHVAINGVNRKLLAQALRQKNITIVNGAQEEDILRYNDTPDGHAVKGDFGPIAEAKMGGIDQMNAQFALQMKGDAHQYAGNLDSLAGLGPQSETLGQDRMIAASSSKMMQAMQEETIAFTQAVFRTLCWYWVHGRKSFDVEVPVPDTPLKVPVKITPEDREGTWVDLNFQVDPYSLQGDSPQGRMAMIDETMMKVVIPLAPILAEQNMAPNIQGYLRLKGRYSNTPDMDDLVIFNEPSQDDRELKSVPRMEAPANKTTTSVRVNRPGATQQGKDLAMMQNYAGKPPQEAQQAAMVRPVG